MRKYLNFFNRRCLILDWRFKGLQRGLRQRRPDSMSAVRQCAVRRAWSTWTTVLDADEKELDDDRAVEGGTPTGPSPLGS